MLTKFQSNLENHIKSGYQIMNVVTADWGRISQEFHQYAEERKIGLLVWNCAEGLRAARWPGRSEVRDGRPVVPKKWEELNKALAALKEASRDPKTFLEFLANESPWLLPRGQTPQEEDAFLIVAFSLDDYFKQPAPAGPAVVTRAALLAYRNALVHGTRQTPLVIVTTNMEHVDKSKPWITPIDYPYPDQAWFEEYIRQTAVESEIPVDPAPDTIPRIAKGLLGLNERDGIDTLMLAIRSHKRLATDIMPLIYSQKAKSLQRSGVLTFVPFENLPNHEQLKGFDLYVDYIRDRSCAYTDEARKLGIDLPKGVILIGVPGTGKSQVAFATASILGLPCVLLDVGAIFDKFVGSSEARVTEALKQVEALSGCVLVIDEADKGFRGMSGGDGDSGVSSRVFGKILSWLANKQDGTFVIMTMNTTDGIPPELLRPGRFDALFSTDLPAKEERELILESHLVRRNIDVNLIKAESTIWQQILDVTEAYTGAELELGVRESRYTAYSRRKTGQPTAAELLAALNQVNPVSKLADTKIDAIRQFCANRTRRVSRAVENREMGGANATTARRTRTVQTDLN